MQDDDKNTLAATSQEIKAAARDMLRMGSRWAHSALDWFDERRHDMNNRNRDDRDFGSERQRGPSPYSASSQDRQERERYEASQRVGGRHEQLQGRSDRDIQGDYSGGGYDQVGARGDWSRGQDEQRYAWGREGGYASRTRSPDDDSLRGDYGSDTGYGSSSGYGASGGYGGAGSGYGASGPGGVGYGAPGYGAGAGYGEPRYHGDFQSRGVGEEEGYGSTGRDVGRGYESDYGRGYGGQGVHSQGGGRQERYAQAWRGERGYGSTGQGYGERGGESQRYDRGLHGQQAFGAQRYGESSGYGSFGERGSQGGQRDDRMQAYGYGSQGGQQRSQMGQPGRSYRGVGPRNYTRSDERIREDLNERLTDAHDIDASQVTVEVNNGVATLSGTVGERWMKHRAEDIADGCSGVRDVRNNLQVESRGSRQDSYGSASGQYAGSGQQRTSGQAGGSTSQGQGGTFGSSAGTSSQGSSLGASGGSTATQAGSGSTASSGGSTQGSGTGRGTSGGGTGPNV